MKVLSLISYEESKNKAPTAFYYADKDLEANNSYVVEDVEQMDLSRSL